MIVRMKHLDLVCLAADRAMALEQLRALGAAHLDLSSGAGTAVAAAEGEAADAEKAVRLIEKARETAEAGDPRAKTVSEILLLAADREKFAAEAAELARQVKAYAPYGDFDPALAAKVLAAVPDLRDHLEIPETLPPKRLAALEDDLKAVEGRVAACTAKIARCDEKAILAKYPALADKVAFERAKSLMAEAGALATLAGWVPEPRVGEIRAKAAEAGWGVLLRDPADGEVPPTLVEPPKFFKPMKALFAGLGIAPAYVEADVSVPFLCYFSLFFAMLVGDGAYGAIFLGATLFGWRRFSRFGQAMGPKVVATRSWLVLMTVFSSATILWGLLSNTWFGAGLPFAKDWPTVKWLADPSYHNMMLLCFTIGVSHLMLARIWNGLCMINDSTCVSQFGWAGVLLFMYLVTNNIVGIFPTIPVWAYWMFGASLVAVFGFSVKPSELKTRGAELGMLPLNIMSALGDIISYVRLFAVGLASVKVAENFNAMATGLLSSEHAWWLNAILAVAMVGILVVGHVLNLAMAGLSILVHAVRLNTLEFSNHKGVTWSGYAFRAFARNASEK